MNVNKLLVIDYFSCSSYLNVGILFDLINNDLLILGSYQVQNISSNDKRNKNFLFVVLFDNYFPFDIED